MDRPRRKQRTFYFGKRRNWGRCLMAVVFGVILIVSSVKLISYGVDYYNAQQASASLREIYHAEEEPTAEVEEAETEEKRAVDYSSFEERLAKLK